MPIVREVPCRSCGDPTVAIDNAADFGYKRGLQAIQTWKLNGFEENLHMGMKALRYFVVVLAGLVFELICVVSPVQAFEELRQPKDRVFGDW